MSTVPDGPIFPTIAIVGLGLIGGSIALAVRERWPATRVVGVDREGVLAHAIGSGAIDRGTSGLTDVGAADLIILAAPVRQNIDLVRQIGQQVTHATLITDVGGTKRAIVDAAATLPPALTFIGGHPLGGAAHGGFGFARPDLFARRPWILTPQSADVEGAVGALSQFARGLGAVPAIMTAAEHDRLMAFLSHLPQLAASALMDVVGQAAGEHLALAGAGLVDSTRLASSPAGVWRDICGTNADDIGVALDLLIDKLGELRADLRRGDAVEDVFNEASHWRAELVKRRQ